MDYDLAILGAGPAGAAAAVYAARKQLKTILITDSFGGQSVVSPDIQNWLGEPSISGNELAEKFKNHVMQYAGEVLTVKEGEKVKNVTQKDNGFEAATEKGTYGAHAMLVATGAHRRKLDVPGADAFENKGVTYCASCDGPLFADKDVTVVGGGNAGFETAAQLLAYAKSVTLLHRGEQYKADPVTVKKVLENPKMQGILNADTQEIKGEQFVTGITYKDTKTGQVFELPTQGVFVEIGIIPTTEFVANLVELDDYKRIKIDPWTQKTSLPGIWAAGDSTNVLYHQNNISAGDGVRALEDIYTTLKAK